MERLYQSINESMTPLELFDFVLECRSEPPEYGVTCLLSQPALVQVHLSSVTLYTCQSWWHKTWPNWGGMDPMSSCVSKVKSNSNLIPGVNLLNKDWWITRLGKSWPEKGKENCKWRGGGDHLAWFNKNEDVPLLRIQESGFRRARRSICWRQWCWTLVDFSHKRNTLRCQHPDHLFFWNVEMHAAT